MSLLEMLWSYNITPPLDEVCSLADKIELQKKGKRKIGTLQPP